jgi:hypothetical protein
MIEPVEPVEPVERVERVAFLPAGARSPVPFAELGSSAAGAWGVVSDEPWLALTGEDPLELLYLSHAEYAHAIRRLSATDLPAAIAHRRGRYASDLPVHAMGSLEQAIRAGVPLAPTHAGGSRIRADLLTALASFTVVPRFAHTSPLDLLDYLREGDAELSAELESLVYEAPGEFDRNGSERKAREHFAMDLGALAAKHGRPEKALALPYFDVERVYFVFPGRADLEARARANREPMRKWRGGLILPLPERAATELAEGNQELLALFPAPGPFMSALAELTPAQLEIEFADRMRAPGFAAYLDSRRIGQALLRTAACLMVGPASDLDTALTAQTQEESIRLSGWLRPPAASAGTLETALAAAIALAALLATLCRRRRRDDVARKLGALAHALSQVIAEDL